MAKKKTSSARKKTSQIDALFKKHRDLKWLLLVLAFSFLLITIIK